MHFLDRSLVDVPECLVAPAVDRVYEDLTGGEKGQIRQALLDLQHYRCAYCERRTGDHRSYDGHIEHFRDQADHGSHTLDWDNLFWSCRDERTCGKHKDKCRKQAGSQRFFDHAVLIDPSRDEPDDYLIFVSDGTVAPRSNLAEGANERAAETIRVFQLNESAYLSRARHDAIRPYLSAVTTLTTFGPEILHAYVKRELQQAENAPFGTAIRHFLNSVTP